MLLLIELWNDFEKAFKIIINDPELDWCVNPPLKSCDFRDPLVRGYFLLNVWRGCVYFSFLCCVMHKLIEQLQWRYATKVFDSKKMVSDENIETLVEVLRLTPSSFGVQPWKFLLVKNPLRCWGLMLVRWVELI